MPTCPTCNHEHAEGEWHDCGLYDPLMRASRDFQKWAPGVGWFILKVALLGVALLFAYAALLLFSLSLG